MMGRLFSICSKDDGKDIVRNK